MEILSLVLRGLLVVLGLTLCGLSTGSLTRPGVGWAQRARFVFIAGISVVAVLRGAELFSQDALPIWVLLLDDAFFAVGVWGSVNFYREFPGIPLPPVKK